jgi:hypothetical protein
MESVTIDSNEKDVNRLGEVLDLIAELTLEADEIKDKLKAQAELLGDVVAFAGGKYVAKVTVWDVKKTDWKGVVVGLNVPQKTVDRYVTTERRQVCSVKKQD